MAIPVGRPIGYLDANGRVIPASFTDQAYQADNGGGATLTYEAWANPGTATSAAKWKLCKHTYDASTPPNRLTTTWPKLSGGNASNDYIFVYADRATYTYS